MKHIHSPCTLLLAAGSILVAALTATADDSDTPKTTAEAYGGSAFILSTQTPYEDPLPDVPVLAGDTGPLPIDGGRMDESLPFERVNTDHPSSGPIQVDIMNAYASVEGKADRSDATVYVERVEISIWPIEIVLEGVQAKVAAYCCTLGAQFQTEQMVAEKLTINGEEIEITGEESQRIPFPPEYFLVPGEIVLNERTQTWDDDMRGAITMHAVRITTQMARNPKPQSWEPDSGTQDATGNTGGASGTDWRYDDLEIEIIIGFAEADIQCRHPEAITGQDEAELESEESAHQETIAAAGEWAHRSWLGQVFDTGGWIYHAEHRWLYYVAGEAGGSYIYDSEIMAWGWSAEDVYPWIYWEHPIASWTYYYTGSEPGNRWFVHSAANEDRHQDDLAAD